MTDNKEFRVTCPICGYTDTALDKDSMEADLKQHTQNAHNQTLLKGEASDAVTPEAREDAPDTLVKEVVPAQVVNNTTTNIGLLSVANRAKQ